MAAGVERSVFGTTKGGKEIYKYKLTNSNGIQLQVISFGAIIVAIKSPDRNGKVEDIVLGYDDIDGYKDNPPYFGSTCGRVANRIANGRFSIDGKEYQLACNNGPNHLHGGIIGYNKVLWQSEAEGDHVIFTYCSPDGEEGYPGEVNVTVKYTLTDDNEIKISYRATSTKATPINLTNHSYFNLAGQVDHDVLNHTLWINAECYLPTNDVQIPTGELRPVSGEPGGAFDFSKPKLISKDINKVEPGYDHNFCLQSGKDCKARLSHAASGRVLEIYTDQPGLQVYTGNFLEGVTGKGGLQYHTHYGVALETQNYPDAINHPTFPNSVIRPGEEYRHETVFKLLVQK